MYQLQTYILHKQLIYLNQINYITLANKLIRLVNLDVYTHSKQSTLNNQENGEPI